MWDEPTPVLHLADIPSELFDRIQQLAAAHNCTVEAEALHLLQQALVHEMAGRSQAELLDDLRRRSFTPAPGTPESVELLDEDRAR
jgi:hypothetical protein